MKKMNITIKTEKNIDIITQLNRFVHQIHVRNHPEIFREYDYDSMLQGMTGFLMQEFVKCLIVYNNDDPAGYAVFYRRNYPEHLFRQGYATIYIDQMCVKPDYQKQGIGKKIIDFLKEYAANENIHRIELSVWADNTDAIQFYRKTGFEPYIYSMKIGF